MFNQLKEVVPDLIFGPVVLAADNTPAAVSLANHESALVSIAVGIGGITFTSSDKIEFKLTHCATEDGSYAAVAQADVRGVTVGTGGIVLSLVTEHAAASVTTLSYVGGNRYLKLLADFGGTHGTGTPITAMIVRGHPHAST